MAASVNPAPRPERPAPARQGAAETAPVDVTALAVIARTGDPAGVRLFVQAILPSVRRMCRAVLGPQHSDLEDTIQECLLEILRALRGYRFEGSSILHYTNRITVRFAIAVRKRGRNREQHLRAFAAAAPETSVPGRQDSVPDLRLLRTVLDELSKVQAEAVVLRVLFGYSLEELAVATGVSVNTIKSRIRTAKDHLRQRLPSEPRLSRSHASAPKLHPDADLFDD